MYKKILVGVDASDESTKALHDAATLAKIFGAQLHVFHAVTHHLDYPSVAMPIMVPFAGSTSTRYNMNIEELHASYERAGREIMADAQDYIERLQLGLEPQYHLEIDVAPEDFAIEFAQKNHIDLIVLGCRGHHSRFRTALLGTVATKIINEAPCQVLIIR